MSYFSAKRYNILAYFLVSTSLHLSYCHHMSREFFVSLSKSTLSKVNNEETSKPKRISHIFLGVQIFNFPKEKSWIRIHHFLGKTVCISTHKLRFDWFRALLIRFRSKVFHVKLDLRFECFRTFEEWVFCWITTSRFKTNSIKNFVCVSFYVAENF